MKRIALAVLTLAFAACSATDRLTQPSKEMPISVATSNGFDVTGYNDVANTFNGTADGVDRVMDGLSWGVDTPYDEDHLLMKWNHAWETCNADRTPANCAGAWLTNQWNGKAQNGSDETWHYKFLWYGTCVEGSLLPDGSVCIWGEYAMKLSMGNVDGQHIWDVHATPMGFGIK